MPISWDVALGVHPLALELRAHRAEILSSNVANEDTPHYKAKDFDFDSIMRSAIDQQENLTLRRTHTHHIAGSGVGASPLELKYRVPHTPALDGNTVDIELERAEFMTNSLNYATTLRFLDGKFKSLNKAIQGQ